MAASRGAIWTATDWRALLQYASPVFFRGNPFALTALALLISSLAQTVSDGITPTHHGVNASAMGISFAMSAIATHYWRQVDNPLAMAVPGLHRSEHRGAMAFAAIASLVIASILIESGATVGGAAAYVATALAFGSFVPTQKSSAPGQAAVRMLIMLPVMLMSFLPGVQDRMLTLSPLIGWPIAVLALCGIAVGLSFNPVRANPSVGQVDALLAQSTLRRARTPKGHSLDCLPASLSSSSGLFGEIGGQVVRFAMFLVFSIPSALMTGHAHGSTLHAAKAVLRIETPVAGSFALMTAGDWLRRREDWPILFATGWHGTRAQFARALTRAVIRRVLVASLTNAGLTIGILMAVGSLSLRSMPITGCAVAGALFGAGCLPCIAVLLGRFGSQGVVFAAAILGMILASTVCTSVALGHHPAGLIGSGALFLTGLALILATPGKLARTDWPLEKP